MERAYIIQGGTHRDERGLIAFANDFDLENVRRFYRIEPVGTEQPRAWQGHKQETKWFYCTKGSFTVKLIRPDNWLSPAESLPVETFIIRSGESNVLVIPGGYFNGFKALEDDSSLIVFSDMGLEDSKNDDFRLPLDYWTVNWNESDD